MKTKLTLTLALLVAALCTAQNKEVSIYLSHKYNGETFQLNQDYFVDDSINLNISRLEYYLNINELTNETGSAVSFDDKYLLVNTTKQHYALGSHDITAPTTLSFHIGVSPELNHEDPTLWAVSHPLAPQDPSMHWGWSSGYRFIALEAMVDQDSDGVMESVLQYHAVSDSFYVEVIQSIEVIETEESITIYMDANYDKLLGAINASNAGVFHGDQDENLALVNNFVNNAVFTTSEDLTLDDYSSSKTVYPNPCKGSFNIDLADESNVSLYNSLGELISSKEYTKGVQNINCEMLSAGFYFVSITDKAHRETIKIFKN